MTQCGYISLLGQPNAGKSTLLNAILGKKIVGVSSKPQTTRAKVLGVYTEGESQFIFLDTPGIHKTHGSNLMNKRMNKAAWSVLKDADIHCYLIDGAKGIDRKDEMWIKELALKTEKPIFILATKKDKLKKHLIEENLVDIETSVKAIKESLEGKCSLRNPILISSKVPSDVKSLLETLTAFLPESPWFFSEDDITDRPLSFICSELIREQIFRKMGQELPYSIGVRVEKLEKGKSSTKILATIIVNRESHKPMVIGKAGGNIKEIGKLARESLEDYLGRKVYLELFVKVQKEWFQKESDLREITGMNDF